MEGADNVQAQTQTLGETGGGIPAEPQSQDSGVSAEPTAAAEPTAQPTAESAQVSEGSPQVVQESFPEVDSFAWDEWDGETYDNFPEQVRSWADKIGSVHSKRSNSERSQFNTELEYWKRMYEALQYGDEDPRIADMASQIEQMTSQNQEWEQKFSALEKDVETEREQENERYFKWFERNYEGKLDKLAADHGAEAAEKMVLDLMDLEMDVHVAVEVSLMGQDAVNMAKELSSKVSDTNLVLEILKSRYPTEAASANKTQPAAVAREEKPVNPATQVVAGSAPVSRPAQLAKEKAPAYGSANQRMASLMSAAENAIRKSKRR